MELARLTAAQAQPKKSCCRKIPNWADHSPSLYSLAVGVLHLHYQIVRCVHRGGKDVSVHFVWPCIRYVEHTGGAKVRCGRSCQMPCISILGIDWTTLVTKSVYLNVRPQIVVYPLLCYAQGALRRLLQVVRSGRSLRPFAYTSVLEHPSHRKRLENAGITP